MEIKKAFEQFKKELKKETGISGGFTMTAKQIKNRTATYCINNAIPFEMEIERELNSDKKVQAYESWSKEMKADFHERTENLVARYEARLKKYGTKQREAAEITKQVVNSKAFKKFSEQLGNVEYNNEEMNGCYYIRFNY